MLHNLLRSLVGQASQVHNYGILLVALCVLGVSGAWTGGQQQRVSAFAARRAADDSRPLIREANSGRLQMALADTQDASVVMGRFRAPAPERVHRQRVPKSSQTASQTLSASFQVAEQLDASSPRELVHGIVGASASSRQRARPDQRTLSAKMQVSDEGLNYPPSKLSADIYGNVAEIVTAPPEAVESDFLLPNSRRFSG